MEIHLTTTECHLPYGITQCYLPPDTNERTPPSPQPTVDPLSQFVKDWTVWQRVLDLDCAITRLWFVWCHIILFWLINWACIMVILVSRRRYWGQGHDRQKTTMHLAAKTGPCVGTVCEKTNLQAFSISGWIISVFYTGWSKKTVPQCYFCDNFRKCTPILTIFSLLEPAIYDA